MEEEFRSLKDHRCITQLPLLNRTSTPFRLIIPKEDTGWTRLNHGGEGVNHGGSCHNTLPARPLTGRHFKPFDHRKMNPMADIQEDPYGPPASVTASPGAANNGNNNLIVQHKNTSMPHMPQNLRHTNYSSSNNKAMLVNPKLIDHRDSANFSLASSDSG